MALLLVSIILCFALLGWNADASSSFLLLSGLQASLSLAAAHRRGLLRGVGNIELETVAFYADAIDMSGDGLAWLSEPGLMWEAAEKDAADKGVPVKEYVANLKANMTKFANSDVVYGREELLLALRMAFSGDGQFCLLLGGKNVGKSIILQTLRNEFNNANANAENETRRLILYVDARGSPGDLEAGLAESIATLCLKDVVPPDKFESANLRGPVGAYEEILKDNPLAAAALRPWFERLTLNVLGTGTSAQIQSNLLTTFVELAKTKNAYPVVIIDEANVVLGDGTEDTKNFLINLVKRTKQDKQLTMIMASSEHSYPYRLESEGLNLEDVSWVIFAGEIPPSDMWKLLVNATNVKDSNETVIGMGPRLAELCLAAYGGHFLRVQNAISELSLQQARFKALSLFPDLVSNILTCLDTDKSTRPLLEALAKSGLAPIATHTNTAVEMIVKLNIGGVVRRGSNICGLSETKWAGTKCDYALIPSSESVRLAIARSLDANPASTLFWSLRLYMIFVILWRLLRLP
jgi:hypothetical protein